MARKANTPMAVMVIWKRKGFSPTSGLISGNTTSGTAREMRLKPIFQMKMELRALLVTAMV